MLWSGWSKPFFWFPIFLVFLPRLLRSFQPHQVQLLSLSLSASRFFFFFFFLVFLQGPIMFVSYHFLSFLLYDSPDENFSFFFCLFLFFFFLFFLVFCLFFVVGYILSFASLFHSYIICVYIQILISGSIFSGGFRASGPVVWGCRIHRLHFCRGVRHECFWVWH